MLTTPDDLTDARFWARPDRRDVIDGLRATDPVQRCESAAEGPVVSVLGHRLGSDVLHDAETFTSTRGSLLGSGRGVVPAGSSRMMALTDGPRHRDLRGTVVRFLSPRAVRGAAQRIAEVADSVVAEAVEKGDVDLVDVVSAVPLTVMCDLLDIPADDRDLVVQVCDEAFLGTTPEARRAGHQRLIPYLFEQVMRRRAAPGDDLVSTLATRPVAGRPLPVEDVVLNLDNLLVGGVQTVRHTAAMAVWALVRHPECWRRLQDGETPLDAAVDELLRWTSVGLHVLRTAVRDTVLGGHPIEPGERVVVWMWAANHDPDVFDRPERLLLDRSPNRHLALGVGAHYCIGAPLAKAELAAIFSALLARVDEVQPTTEPEHNSSIINFGLDRFPVRLPAR